MSIRAEGTSFVTAGLSRTPMSLTGIVSMGSGRSDTTATTGSLTTVFTYTLPANTLNPPITVTSSGYQVGGSVLGAKGLRVNAMFLSTAAATSKVAAILFGGTSIATNTAISTASSSIMLEAYVWRTGAQAADAWGRGVTTATNVFTNVQALSGTTFNFSGYNGTAGAGIPILFQVNHATASDVSLRWYTIELLTEGAPV